MKCNFKNEISFEGEAFNLPVNIHLNPKCWSWALDGDQNDDDAR